MSDQSLADDSGKIKTCYPNTKRFIPKASQLHTCVTNNEGSIPNYGKRRQHGMRIASSFAESTDITIIGMRFAKNQQMQWSKHGAHHLLQTRASTLDGILHTMLENGIQA